jgi:hypothetical protein
MKLQDNKSQPVLSGEEERYMKKKIIGIFICLLLIATAIPAVESLKNNAIDSTIPSHPLTSMAGNWTEMQKLLASDGEEGDSFSCPISLDGDTAFIGAPGGDDNGTNAGSAYVFTRTGTVWTQQQKLLPSDGAAGDAFGCSISLDGDTAIIGAKYDDDNGIESGSVYVFTRTGSTWTQQAKLLPSGSPFAYIFGSSVSLDGNTALIGANQYNYYIGAAYVFTGTGTTWIEQQILSASDGAPYDGFGTTVSLEEDTALIGACGHDHNGFNFGSAFVFTRTDGNWTEQAELLASDGEEQDTFGRSVSLSGNTALIGVTGDQDNGYESGSAYVFTRTGTTWTQQAKLLASDGIEWDEFGCSVSLDGDTAFIGAPGDDDNAFDSGSAYMFTRTGTTWTQQQKFLTGDSALGDFFGSVISLDGDTVFIGAPGDDDKGIDSGSVYVFRKENQPPNPPIINGPTIGRVGVAYNFTVVTTDPDGDEFFYLLDWGDGNSSGWLGPYASGEIFTISHAWNEPGTYMIKVKAKDPYGEESNSNPFDIQIVELKTSFIIGSFNNWTETEDLIIISTNFLIIFPSDSLLYSGATLVIAKNYRFGFFISSIFGGIFEAILLSENPSHTFDHPLKYRILNRFHQNPSVQ